VLGAIGSEQRDEVFVDEVDHEMPELLQCYWHNYIYRKYYLSLL
jgi:hypothetical protein